MRTAVIVLITIFLWIAWTMDTASSQEDMQAVDNGQFDHPQRPPAVFQHDTHNENAGIDDCNECHHLHDDQGRKLEGESSEDQQCSECHEPQDKGVRPGLMKAYHLNCKGCHLQERKGPILCAQCHKK